MTASSKPKRPQRARPGLRIGAVEQSKFDAAMKSGASLPSLHSALFAPDRERTIKAAVAAEVVSLRELMPAVAARAPQ